MPGSPVSEPARHDIHDEDGAKHQFQEIVEHGPAIIYIARADAVISTAYISPQITRVLGYTPDEFIANPALWFELLHPDDLPLFAADVAAQRAKAERASIEYRLIARDGRIVWFRDEIAYVRDGRGELKHIRGVLLDITAQKQAEEALRHAAAIIDTSQDAIMSTDPNGIIRTWNPSAERIYGYSAEEIIGQSVRLLLPEGRLENERTVRDQLLRGEHPEPRESVRRRKDGRLVDVSISHAPILDESGAVVALATIARDITEQKQAERALRRSEERFRSLIQNATDLITLTDANGVILYESPAITEMLGLLPHETIGNHLFDEVHPDDRPRAVEYLRDAVDAPGPNEAIELRFRHVDGSWRSIEACVTNLLEDPAVAAMVFNSHDVTERRMFEEQLQRQAFYDPLTGLPNRSLLLDRIEHALARTKRGGHRVAVAFLDLDRFKVVNDSLGHAAGDRLLVNVAHRLLDAVRAEDTVARLGGDEFVVLIEDVADLSEVAAIARRVIDIFQTPVAVDDHEAFVATSIGVALSGERGEAIDSGELLRNADIALYRAKGEGRGRFVIFDPSMNVFSAERLSLESDLQRAVERGELRLAFQPEVDLRTGKITGLEALARWEHPRRGLIAPGDFIPIAEETGLIVQIGQWVLEEACRQARAWRDQALTSEPLTIAVNLSARQFQQAGLVEHLECVLADTDIEPAQLRLEITESVLVQEAGAARATLQRVKDLGVQIAIDDFGIGYSSLAYLTRLLADTLKVDRSFVAAIGRDEQSFAIVAAVASLAHALGMSVTAEGIETARQLELVRASGCDHGQGYHFSKPVSAAVVETLVSAPGFPPNPDSAHLAG